MNISSAGIYSSYAGSPGGSSSVFNRSPHNSPFPHGSEIARNAVSSSGFNREASAADVVHSSRRPGSAASAEATQEYPVRKSRSMDAREQAASVESAPGSVTTDRLKPSEDVQVARERQRQAREQQLIQSEIKTLAARDREVRAHEQAHMAVGGQYAGAAVYQYERGPNGVSYAVGGEVPISTSEEATPEATLRKAQIIRRAALAPAEPSPQDRRIAAMATRMEAAARAEIARARASREDRDEGTSAVGHGSTPSETTEAKESASSRTTAPPAIEASVRHDQNRLLHRLSTREHVHAPSPGTLLSISV